MVNSRQKGNRGEQQVMSLLGRMTEEKWEQTPGSGSGKVKGDLRVPGKHNLFCIEVKFHHQLCQIDDRYPRFCHIASLLFHLLRISKHVPLNRSNSLHFQAGDLLVLLPLLFLPLTEL